MTKDNPFPGMNPFLERHWPDVHTKLITYAADAIAEQLPADLIARSEERVGLHQPEGGGRELRADVAVVESWKSGIAPQWQPETAAAAGGLTATQPVLIHREEEVERWIEITDPNGRLITVIEILSPTNKGDGASAYRARRNSYLGARVNVVEIDLLRGGGHVLAATQSELAQARKAQGTHYTTCVSRAARPHLIEVYATPLREPLPVLSIPLRAQDKDVLLPLQPLIDRCHRMGAYWNADYDHLPGPGLPADEAAWVAECLLTIHETKQPSDGA